MLSVILILTLGSLPHIASSSASCSRQLCHIQGLCRFGYIQDPSGCDTCLCVDPCEAKQCSGGDRCFVTEMGAQCLDQKKKRCHRNKHCPQGFTIAPDGITVTCNCHDWCQSKQINCAEGQTCKKTSRGIFQCEGTPKCNDDICYLNCPKGFQLDDYGCKTCACLDACEGHKCKKGLWCRVDSHGDAQCVEPPKFTKNPQDVEIDAGGIFVLSCETDVDSAKLSWRFNDGPLPITSCITTSQSQNFVSVVQALPVHSGTYHCDASGPWGTISASAEVVVKPSVPPTIVSITTNTTAEAGSRVVLECIATGKPDPDLTWYKNDILINSTAKIQSFCNGTLVLDDVTKYDEGIYTCEAKNLGGSTVALLELIVTFPDGNTAPIAIEKLKQLVEKSKELVYQKVQEEAHLKKDIHKKMKPSDQLRRLRTPSKEAKGTALASDIMAVSLEEITKACTHSSETPFEHFLDPNQISVIAKLSGCDAEEHKKDYNCSDICFNSKYRQFNGRCNNLKNPSYGAAVTPLVRLLPAEYDNKFSFPKGSDPTRTHNGYALPSARSVSIHVASSQQISFDRQYSHMLMQWGQFIDHDLGLSVLALTNSGYGEGAKCDESCKFDHPCFPILIPEDDPRINTTKCMPFIRSSASCGISADYQSITPREQLNALTAYIDASHIYGNSDEIGNNLRDFNPNKGLLREGVVLKSGKALLPPNSGEDNDCPSNTPSSSNSTFFPCFQAGDIRANEQLGLLSMHTLWFREHNRVARKLSELNPYWGGDLIYQEARKIVGAEIQHITFYDWLPHILGKLKSKQVGPYEGYDSSVNPGLANSFSTAAFRFGHGLIKPVLERLDCMFQPIPEGHLRLHEAFFSPMKIVQHGGMDPYLRGLFGSSCKEIKPDQMLNAELTERLFELAHNVALDLAALNIQRGRDHGLPGYNAYRKLCGLTEAQTFEDLKYEIKDSAVREKLKDLYQNVDNIDLFVGGLLENPKEGAITGPTFAHIIKDQFQRLRAGDSYFEEPHQTETPVLCDTIRNLFRDRILQNYFDSDWFWYEKDDVLTPAQLTEIKQTSLARVICDNADAIEHVGLDVFKTTSFPGKAIPCGSPDLPRVDLTQWQQCCESDGCSHDEEVTEDVHYEL